MRSPSIARSPRGPADHARRRRRVRPVAGCPVPIAQIGSYAIDERPSARLAVRTQRRDVGRDLPGDHRIGVARPDAAPRSRRRRGRRAVLRRSRAASFRATRVSSSPRSRRTSECPTIVPAGDSGEHRRRDLPGVRALVLPVHVLRVDEDVRAAQRVARRRSARRPAARPRQRPRPAAPRTRRLARARRASAIVGGIHLPVAHAPGGRASSRGLDEDAAQPLADDPLRRVEAGREVGERRLGRTQPRATLRRAPPPGAARVGPMPRAR